MIEVGKRIKQIRQALELTQAELAERADLTKGFISQIENDLTSPSVENLMAILNVLDERPSDFFSEKKKQVVYKKEDFTDLDREGMKQCMLLVSGSTSKEMEPLLLTLAPNEETSLEEGHYGEEFGYVLSGTVHLRLGESNYRVNSGQCFYYEANKIHALMNSGCRDAKVLWVSSPPSF